MLVLLLALLLLLVTITSQIVLPLGPRTNTDCSSAFRKSSIDARTEWFALVHSTFSPYASTHIQTGISVSYFAIGH